MNKLATSLFLMTAFFAAATAGEMETNYALNAAELTLPPIEAAAVPAVTKPMKDIGYQDNTNSHRLALNRLNSYYYARETAAADARIFSEKLQAAGYTVLDTLLQDYPGFKWVQWDSTVRYTTADGSPAWNVQTYFRRSSLERRPYRTLAAAESDARVFEEKFKTAGYAVLAETFERMDADVSGFGCEAWYLTLEYIAKAGLVPGEPQTINKDRDDSGMYYTGPAGSAKALAEAAAMDTSLRAAGYISLGAWAQTEDYPRNTYSWHAEYLRPINY